MRKRRLRQQVIDDLMTQAVVDRMGLRVRTRGTAHLGWSAFVEIHGHTLCGIGPSELDAVLDLERDVVTARRRSGDDAQSSKTWLPK